MAQKITGYIKLQIPAGKATPAPPVGPHSVSMVLTSWSLPRHSMKEQKMM